MGKPYNFGKNAKKKTIYSDEWSEAVIDSASDFYRLHLGERNVSMSTIIRRGLQLLTEHLDALGQYLDNLPKPQHLTDPDRVAEVRALRDAAVARVAPAEEARLEAAIRKRFSPSVLVEPHEEDVPEEVNAE